MKRNRLIAIGVLLLVLTGYTAWMFVAGPTLIVRQIHNQNTRIVKLFCLSGVTPNRDAWMAGGIFHCAVANGNRDMVKMLISHGANMNRIDGYGATPLDVATSTKDVPMMQLLVENGSDISKRNRSGETALDIAIREKLDETRNFLERIGKQAN